MDNTFNLKYIETEYHLMMPTLKTLVINQGLYDILFQYVLTPEQEKQLTDFIDLIQRYKDNKAHHKAPFSLPKEDLEFLEEGLEELRMLCWQTIPVMIFEVEMNEAASSPSYQAARDQMENILMELFVYTWRGEKQILVYPPAVV
ncbi:MAG: hypothetical protein ACM3QW_09445 [Ignavibacteriales bacterium]